MKVQHVQRQAEGVFEGIINNDSKLHEVFEPGKDAVAQGDYYFVSLGKLPKSAQPRSNRQIAEGTTQGARHVLERGEIYECDRDVVAKMIKKLYGLTIDPEYIGPVFVSPANPTADDLSHPEHGNQGFPAGSVVGSICQRTVDSEQRIARVRD